MKIISYEDEHVRVIYHPGEDENLIITFGDMFMLAKGDSFFAENPISKRNLNAIGFMAKDRNWYPLESVRKAAECIHGILDKAKFVTLYGGSMGGYAALKFSKLLNANRVISLAPQYSINPSAIKDHRYNFYFNPQTNADNDIHLENLSGEIFITHDPFFEGDDQHVKNIRSLGYPITYLPLRFSMHGATTILASSSFIDEIISAKEIKPAILLGIYRERRRAAPSYIESLAEYLLRRRPSAALRLLSKKLSSNLVNDNQRIRNTLSRALILIYADSKSTDDYGVCESLMIPRKCENGANDGVSIITAHGRMLTYNSLTKSFMQSDKDCIANLPFLHPIIIDGDSGLVKVRFREGQSILVTRQNQVIDILDGKDYNDRNYIIYRKNSHYYAISSATKNLSSSPNGKCEFNVDHVRAWEKYTALTD